MFPADTILGWRPAANKISRHAFDALYFVTNAQGFAVVERFDERFSVPKPANTFRVIVIGGSTVIGSGVADSRVAMPAQLLRLLRDRTDLADWRVEVINAGVPGYDISQEYLYLMTRLMAYQPDLVVAYHGWNDFGLSVRLNAAGPASTAFYTREIPILAERLNQSYTLLGNLAFIIGNLISGVGELWTDSAAGHLIRSAVYRIGGDLTIRPAAGPGTKLEDIRYNPEATEHFIYMMRAMIGLARDRSFQLALVLQPHMFTSAKRYTDWETGYLNDTISDSQAAAARDVARRFYKALRHWFESDGAVGAV